MFKKNQIVLSVVAATLFLVTGVKGQNHTMKGTTSQQKFVHQADGNPYLPLWKHLPDGEPRVFEDPDNPGKYRVYIIGSHDVRFDSYCDPVIRMWSAPVEDLFSWRDEGAIFTYEIDGQWDVMYVCDFKIDASKFVDHLDKKNTLFFW